MMARRLAAWVFRMAGWRVVGPVPQGGPAVLAGGPHTSNVDAFVFLVGTASVGVRLQFLMKREAFRPPFGRLARAVGGVPVDRTSPGGLVRSSVSYLRGGSAFLGILPKGTRSARPYWRPGFYVIARLARVPIIPVAADYATRTLRFGEPIAASGNEHADMTTLRAFFGGVVGRHRDRTDVVRLESEDAPT